MQISSHDLNREPFPQACEARLVGGHCHNTRAHTPPPESRVSPLLPLLHIYSGNYLYYSTAFAIHVELEVAVACLKRTSVGKVFNIYGVFLIYRDRLKVVGQVV